MLSLLPVNPPEINPLIFKWVQNLFKIRQHKIGIRWFKEDCLFTSGVYAHSLGQALIPLFKVTNAISGVKIE